MSEKPAVITLERHYTVDGGWQTFVIGWADKPGGANMLSIDRTFRYKKLALAWCRKCYPGVKLLYCSEMTR